MRRSDIKIDLRALGPNLGEGRGRAERRRRKEIEKEEERKRKGREGSRDLRRRGSSLTPFPRDTPRRAFQFQKKTTLTWNGMTMEMRKRSFFSRFPPNPKN